MFDRLVQLGHVPTRLTTQYRCHPTIAQVCNHLFYENTLSHGVSGLDRPSLIPHLPPIVAIECRGTEERRGESLINQAEAALIRDLVVWIKKQITGSAGEQSSIGSADVGATSVGGGATKNISIGVICLYKAQESIAMLFLPPYWHIISIKYTHLMHTLLSTSLQSQVTAINNLLMEVGLVANTVAKTTSSVGSDPQREDDSNGNKLLVSTVDSFQGNEMDIIIIAITKNQHNSFISNNSRVNVAVSRARHHLIVIGNGAMLMKAPLWSHVISSAEMKVMSIDMLEQKLKANQK